MAERSKATAMKRKQFKTSSERAAAVVARRRDNWPGESPIMRSKAHWLPKLRKGGGQGGR